VTTTPAARQVGAFHRLAALSEAEIAAAGDATVPVGGPTAVPAPDLPLPLDPREVDAVRLVDALGRRRTSRNAPDDPLPVQDLAWLLGHAAGADAEGRRPHPSAGARYALRLDLVALRCAGIAAGVHRYDAAAHGLRTTVAGDLAEAVGVAFGRAWVRDARALLVVSADLGEATIEHDVRGYRYALLEAGHLAQNLLLLAAAVDLPACPLGGFADRPLSEILTDPVGEVPLYALAL
jgi:SagB-type dehydrogenase family enzyme